MSDDKEKVHIEIHLAELESYLDSLGEDVEVYKLASGMRSEVSVTPEVIMAVVTAASIVIRQLIISLFGYLKSRQEVKLKIKVGDNQMILNYSDRFDDSKLKKVIQAIQENPKKVKITRDDS